MKTKNTIKIVSAAAFALLLCVSCTDFDKLNTDHTKSTTMDPNSQLAYVQLLTWGDWMTLEPFHCYFSAFTQQMMGNWNVTNYGGQYRRDNSIMAYVWQRIYGTPIKNLEDILANTEDVEQYGNVRSIARIMRVYYYMLLTDTYGDIPYTEAGKGYISGIFNPSYNRQQYIYKDFLQELTEVEAALAEGSGPVTGDVIYSGNLIKWQRFANSLRLRLAMRLVKADPVMAKEQVIDLLGNSSGLLTASDDAMVEYQNIFDWESSEFRRNGLAQTWRSRDSYPTACVCSTFWNYLKETSDPRMYRVFRIYYENAEAANNPFLRVDLTEEVIARDVNLFQPCKPGDFWYAPWPSGYYSSSQQVWIDKALRPQLHNNFLKGDMPGVLMTYAETQLLMAEAVVRWGGDLPVSTTAEQYYANGVTAAMNFLSAYNIDIPSAEITAYLSANPLPAQTQERLSVINRQLWVLHLNNAPEAFANWRRSGYPALQPTVDYGNITIESQTIPRRLNYPVTEASYNSAAYLAALEAMGGTDSWNNRVWWDAE